MELHDNHCTGQDSTQFGTAEDRQVLHMPTFDVGRLVNLLMQL
jgi:hypothetical protein